jgi:hypothetical protein
MLSWIRLGKVRLGAARSVVTPPVLQRLLQQATTPPTRTDLATATTRHKSWYCHYTSLYELCVLKTYSSGIQLSRKAEDHEYIPDVK